MSDEKATRYNSKQSFILGKFEIHAAYRDDSPLAEGKNPDKQVYSLSPLFFQQDHYCLSTTHTGEHHYWPKKSSTIIETSKGKASGSSSTVVYFC